MSANNIQNPDSGAASGAARSKGQILAGRILHAVVIVFMIVDFGMKLLRMQPAVDATVSLGFRAGAVFVIGLFGLACFVVYAIPRTAPIGAVLWTGYLGGAIAIQMRAGSSAFENMFPLFFAIAIWGNLWLRDSRVDAFLSARGRKAA